MAKVGKENVRITSDNYKNDSEKIVFDYEIHVNSKGLFYARIPLDISNLLYRLGIDNSGSRCFKQKFENEYIFTASNLNDLKNEVFTQTKKLLEYEVIFDQKVISYSIDTNCKYVLSEKNEIFPNGTFCTFNNWQQGTINDYYSYDPFSISVFAKIISKKIYRFKKGVEKQVYEKVNAKPEDGHYLHLLNSFNISYNMDKPLNEIEYTEKNAKFFYDLLINICKYNELLKPYRDNPESIKDLINSTEYELLD